MSSQAPRPDDTRALTPDDRPLADLPGAVPPGQIPGAASTAPATRSRATRPRPRAEATTSQNATSRSTIDTGLEAPRPGAAAAIARKGQAAREAVAAKGQAAKAAVAERAQATIDKVYPFIGKTTGQRIAVLAVAVLPMVFTLMAIALLWGRYVGWLDIALLLGFWAIAGMGVSVGYHRMTAHKAFKAPAPVRAVLLWMSLQALQGGPATWAATHRRHHALSDQPGDPHSPLDGLWHAHVGWMWKGNLVHDGPVYKKLMQDPLIRFFERTQGIWYALTFVLPGLIGLAVTQTWMGGVQAALWGGAVRVFMGHHITWSINSICHTFGTRPYDSPDVARNNAFFALVGFGEGWHNNHHAFPRSAYLGHRWYQVDLGKYLILALRPLRLVRDVVVPTREERMAKRKTRRRAPATA